MADQACPSLRRMRPAWGLSASRHLGIFLQAFNGLAVCPASAAAGCNLPCTAIVNGSLFLSSQRSALSLPSHAIYRVPLVSLALGCIDLPHDGPGKLPVEFHKCL